MGYQSPLAKQGTRMSTVAPQGLHKGYLGRLPTKGEGWKEPGLEPSESSRSPVGHSWHGVSGPHIPGGRCAAPPSLEVTGSENFLEFVSRGWRHWLISHSPGASVILGTSPAVGQSSHLSAQKFCRWSRDASSGQQKHE